MAADDLPKAPALMSLEGRANMIADQVNRIDHGGDPAKRKEAVRREALAHLQVVAARATMPAASAADIADREGRN